MKHRTLVFVLAALGCASSRPPPAPAPTPTAAVTADAGAPPSTAAADAGGPLAPCAPDERCLDVHRPRLLGALAEAGTHPDDALAHLRGNFLPAAFAWRAYLHHQAGRAEEARRELEAMTAGEVTREEGFRDLALGRILRAIRTSLETFIADTEGDRGLVPCWLFDRHGNDALVAFGAMHMSNADHAMAPFYQRCVEEIVGRRGALDVRAALTATEALVTGLWAVLPVPEDGTMYRGMAIAARQSLYAPLLVGVPADAAVVDAAAVRASAARAASVDRRVVARVRGWTTVRDREATAYGAALCAVPGGPTRTSAQCAALGASVANRALVGWLDAVTNGGR